MAWLITEDLIEKGASVGIVGPTEATERQIVKLKFGEGVKFQMKDDDGNIYYRGLVLGDDQFGPLDDFGEPYAGCTSIEIWDGELYKVL